MTAPPAQGAALPRPQGAPSVITRRHARQRGRGRLAYDVDVTTTEYLGTDEIAALLGVKPQTVRDYAYRGDMPEPDRHFGRSPVWTRETVDAWIASRPRAAVKETR